MCGFRHNEHPSLKKRERSALYILPRHPPPTRDNGNNKKFFLMLKKGPYILLEKFWHANDGVENVCPDFVVGGGFCMKIEYEVGIGVSVDALEPSFDGGAIVVGEAAAEDEGSQANV